MSSPFNKKLSTFEELVDGTSVTNSDTLDPLPPLVPKEYTNRVDELVEETEIDNPDITTWSEDMTTDTASNTSPIDELFDGLGSVQVSESDDRTDVVQAPVVAPTISVDLDDDSFVMDLTDMGTVEEEEDVPPMATKPPFPIDEAPVTTVSVPVQPVVTESESVSITTEVEHEPVVVPTVVQPVESEETDKSMVSTPTPPKHPIDKAAQELMQQLKEPQTKQFNKVDVPVESAALTIDESTGSDTLTEDDDVDDIVLSGTDTTYKTLLDIFNSEIERISAKYDFDIANDLEAFRNEISDKNSLIYQIRRLLGLASANRDFESRVFQTHVVEKLNELTADIRPKSASPKIAFKNNDPEKILNDQQARTFIVAKMRGAKRVFLTNSGFSIYVRPLTNLEISEFVSTVSNEDRDFGRASGGHFYLFSSMHIKQFFASRLPSIVVDCNLQGWKQGDTLIENISLQDYKSILWACACGMYKDGVKFTKICSFCGNEEEVLLNIEKLFFQNEKPLLEGAYQCIDGKKNVTPKDVLAYRNAIKYDTPPTIKIPGYELVLRVPTLSQYLSYANTFITNMNSEVRDLDNGEEIKNYVRYTFYKQYAPWIDRIRSYDDDGELQATLITENSINDFFKFISLEETSLGKEMEEYISKTMLTYIAFPYIECPSCHKVPAEIINGFVSYDIESGFFTMSVMRLRELNSRITD